MLNPNRISKYLYVRKTSIWLVRTIYAFGILTWLPVMFVFLFRKSYDPFVTWFVVPIIAVLSLHFLGSFTLNLFYKRFDLTEHRRKIKRFWRASAEPAVDVFLPVCGEDIEILKRTWKYVSQLKYRNKKVYVLDDSKTDCREHKKLAKQYGFIYFERPNKGEMKKAGNLKYAFELTKGKYIAIFDADFAPHPDFLKELVPYMADKQIGIVQSPQYFPSTEKVHKKTPLAYGAARAQEVFYRIILPARDRLKGAHCCGTCALYRRSALESIGGFVQMGHSEDAHTGFGLTAKGWRIKYIPIILSLGFCPDDVYAFFHQQHRWCLGNIQLILSKKFWLAPVSWKIKFCYLTGFLFYVHQPFVLLLSFHLFWTLFIYNDYITFSAGLLFYPHIIWAFSYMLFSYIAPFRWSYLYAIIMRMYSYCHATATALLGKTVAWIPTGVRHNKVSSAFKQTMFAVGLYITAYSFLFLLAALAGLLHPLNYNYYSVQFWLFYNMALSVFLFRQMRKFYKSTKKSKI